MARIGYNEVAVMEYLKEGDSGGANVTGSGRMERSPLSKARSLSDGGGTQLSPSPLIIEAARRTSKDDSSLRDAGSFVAGATNAAPVTPRRPEFPMRGLSIQLPPRDASPIPTPASIKPSPLSPKLDHSQIYASPTNILPRRSRGLDFSRAATSLHHSTLAEQSSPDSSPTIGGGNGRAMNIPGRKIGDYGFEQSNSLWSMMGNQERMNISSSVGSGNVVASDSSSSSDDDDLMDDDMEDAFMGTPQAAKSGPAMGEQTPQGFGMSPGVPWLASNSPAANSLASFRTRPRKQPKKKSRGLLGLGFKSATSANLGKSPPNNMVKDMKDIPSTAQSRRESISWAANQLHISSADAEDRAMESVEGGQRGVIRRTVTRRGNLFVRYHLSQPHACSLQRISTYSEYSQKRKGLPASEPPWQRKTSRLTVKHGAKPKLSAKYAKVTWISNRAYLLAPLRRWILPPHRCPPTCKARTWTTLPKTR